MKLSNKEIAKVFAMYLPNKPKCLFDGVLRGEIWGLFSSTGNVCIEHNHAGVAQYHHCSTVQLELTPLSKITDEHALEVATRTDYTRKYNTEQPDFSVRNLDDRGFYIGNTGNGASFFWHSLHWRQYQYLISKGYAVPLWFGIDHPANGKTAIELEIAIDKSTLKQ